MIPFDQSDEFKLVLTAARLHVGDAHRDEITRLFARGPDWHSVLDLARYHQVTHLLYGTMVKTGTAVPHDVLNDLREASIAITAASLRFHAALAEMLAAFERCGIRVILLKGAALQQTVYRDSAPRPMHDIDVMVREGEFPLIRTVFEGLGFEPQHAFPELSGLELVEYAHCFDQVKYVDKRRIKVDVHFRLLNMGIPAVSDEAVWERAIGIQVDGVAASVPSPEDMLLHLCFNANHHYFRKLSYFCDINEVYRTYAAEFDWDYFVRSVRDRRMNASIFHAMSYARELLGTTFPADVLAGIKPGLLRRKLYELVWEKTFTGDGDTWRFGNLEGAVYAIFEMDGLGTRLGFLRKCLFPPLDWLAHGFSRPRSVTLYVRYIVWLIRMRKSLPMRDAGEAPRGVNG